MYSPYEHLIHNLAMNIDVHVTRHLQDEKPVRAYLGINTVLVIIEENFKDDSQYLKFANTMTQAQFDLKNGKHTIVYSDLTNLINTLYASLPK